MKFLKHIENYKENDIVIHTDQLSMVKNATFKTGRINRKSPCYLLP